MLSDNTEPNTHLFSQTHVNDFQTFYELYNANKTFEV